MKFIYYVVLIGMGILFANFMFVLHNKHTQETDVSKKVKQFDRKAALLETSTN